jgi:hypothetical protein
LQPLAPRLLHRSGPFSGATGVAKVIQAIAEECSDTLAGFAAAWTYRSSSYVVLVPRFAASALRASGSGIDLKTNLFSRGVLFLFENDDLQWPHRDGLIWPHFSSVVVGVDVD